MSDRWTNYVATFRGIDRHFSMIRDDDQQAKNAALRIFAEQFNLQTEAELEAAFHAIEVRNLDAEAVERAEEFRQRLMELKPVAFARYVRLLRFQIRKLLIEPLNWFGLILLKTPLELVRLRCQVDSIPALDLPKSVLQELQSVSHSGLLLSTVDRSEVDSILTRCLEWLDAVIRSLSCYQGEGSDKGDEWSKFRTPSKWVSLLSETYPLEKETFRKMRKQGEHDIYLRSKPGSNKNSVSLHLTDLNQLGYHGD